MEQQTRFLNIERIDLLPSPAAIWSEIPAEHCFERILAHRDTVRGIIRGEDPRFLVIVGPCSISDPNAALEYASRLAPLAEKYKDRMKIVMRVYLEKPRTGPDWIGFIYEPDLDEIGNLPKGIRLSRKLLVEINELGLPTATEFLDPYLPPYIADLTTWGCVGARTIGSQTHRKLASGLSMPVGLKNDTSGNFASAINALTVASRKGENVGTSPEGHIAVLHTKGNPDCHVVLRGGDEPNYRPEIIKAAIDSLRARKLHPVVVVDCSHANSRKDHREQGRVFREVLAQRVDRDTGIIGAMLESNLFEGRQDIPPEGPSALTYGVSITDACIGWDETANLLREAYKQLGRQGKRA